jgi:hypothetical protein
MVFALPSYDTEKKEADMKRYLILVLLSLALPGFLSAAQKDRDRDERRDREEWRETKGEPGKNWTLLTKQEVNFRDDRDRVKIGDIGRHDGRFKQLQIRVDGPPVEIRKMVVTFDNGEKFDAITTRHRFDDNSRALVIDLPGDRRRDIRDIDIDYFSVRQREGKGTLLVYAR